MIHFQIVSSQMSSRFQLLPSRRRFHHLYIQLYEASVAQCQ